MTMPYDGQLTQCYRGSQGGRPGWWLRFEPNPAVTRGLEAFVPAGDRLLRRSGGLPEWWVAAGYEATLLRLFPGFSAYVAQQQLL